MLFKHGKIFDLYILMIASTVVIILYAVFVSSADKSKFENDDFILANKGFTYQNSAGEIINVKDKIDMPGTLSDITGDTYSLSYKIDSNYSDGNSFVIQTVQQILHVYIGNELIYSFEPGEKAVMKSPGNGIHVIDIIPEYYGKTIRLEYKAVYDKYISEINPVYIGHADDITIFYLKKGLFAIVCCLILVALGIFLIILCIALKFQNMGKSLLYLGIYSIMMGIISFMPIEIVELYFRQAVAARLIVLELLMLVTIPPVLYLREIYSDKLKIFYNIQICVSLTVFVFENVIQVLKIKDFAEILYVTYILIIFTFIVSSITSICGTIRRLFRYEGVDRLGYLRYGLTVITATLLIDIYNFYEHWYTDSSLCSRFGLLIFIIIVAIDALGRLYDMLFMGQKAQMLKEIAHVDVLTKSLSRTAYEEMMTRINSDLAMCKKTAIVSFDVNDLKVMNDSYGHEAGDQYLIDCVRVITDSFSGFGECYRTGGDEFIVIIADFVQKKFNDRINIMKKAVKMCQEETEKPMSMAYGYAVFEENMDDSIYDTAKRADVLMYQAKNEGKRRNKNNKGRGVSTNIPELNSVIDGVQHEIIFSNTTENISQVEEPVTYEPVTYESETYEPAVVETDYVENDFVFERYEGTGVNSNQLADLNVVNDSVSKFEPDNMSTTDISEYIQGALELTESGPIAQNFSNQDYYNGN